MKKLITGLLTASLLLGTLGTMTAVAEEPANYNQDAVVTMAFNGPWDLICPLAATADYGDCIANPIFDRLVEEDGKGGYAPRLCESFELSEDGKIFTMHLQQNAKWHDGEPFTADDVVFTFQLYSNANLTTSRRLFLQGIEGCDASGVELEPGSIHVEKVDDYTVNIYYANPRSVPAIFTSNRYFTILPKHCLEDKDPATILEDDFWTAPIGSGPFKFESQVPGESVTFTANPDYYLGAPKFNTLVIRVITPANLTTAMMAGEVDVINGTLANIPDADMEMAQEIEGYDTEAVAGTSSHYFVINNDVFNTPKIRKAFAMLLDKDAMIASGCYGNGEKVYTMYTEKNLYYDQAVVDELGYEFDPEAAIEMLKEEGFDFDRTYKCCINDLAVRQAIMTVMQDTWAQYGLKLEITTLDTQTCIAETRDGTYDMWINGGSSADYAGLVTSFKDWVIIDENGDFGTYNLARVTDPTMMNLENALMAATTQEEIQEIATELQKVMLTDYNYVYIVGPYINTSISSRLHGVDRSMMLCRGFNFSDWYVEE